MITQVMRIETRIPWVVYNEKFLKAQSTKFFTGSIQLHFEKYFDVYNSFPQHESCLSIDPKKYKLDVFSIDGLLFGQEFFTNATSKI